MHKNIRPASFGSILFDSSVDEMEIDKTREPEFFKDLNLDQIIDLITKGKDECNLKPFFYMSLKHPEAVSYRHEILRDLEKEDLRAAICSFSQDMRMMRHHLVQVNKLSHERQKQIWLLEAVHLYCKTVDRLTKCLQGMDLKSSGFRALSAYLTTYVASERFTSLSAETHSLKNTLSNIQYVLHIKGTSIEVSQYEPQEDFSAEVLKTFERFRQGPVRDEYRFDFTPQPEMNHVEEAVLDLISQLYPDPFSSLRLYYDRYHDYIDHTVVRFDREVQFYMAYLAYIEQLKQTGMLFCYPEVTDSSKEIHAEEAFDLALASKAVKENYTIITNDFYLKNPERIFIVSGANQGGKTTFARMFGQLHYLMSLGCPVPGKKARLFLYDRLFTHFEKEENIESLKGKLESDLFRIHHIFEQATSKSILIMNESFLATTVSDALFLSKKIMQHIVACDMLCVSVTFLDEMSSVSPNTVSMVSTVDSVDQAKRTFKVVRKSPNGLSYAAAIAGKYGLNYETIKRCLSGTAAT